MLRVEGISEKHIPVQIWLTTPSRS